jgi:hypothetical protein
MVAGGHAFASARDWLGAEAVPLFGEARERALAELARRYLAGHAPATERDLAKWAGLPLRDVRSGLRSIGAELVELDGGLLDLARRSATDPAAAQPPGVRVLPARLLPAWDPCTVGWKARDPFVLPLDDHIVVPDGGGLFRPVAMVDGVAAGTWILRRQGARATIRIDTFRALPEEARAELAAEALDVARFEGRALAETDLTIAPIAAPTRPMG